MTRLLLCILFICVATIALLLFLERHLIFYPDRNLTASPDHFGLAYEDVYFTASDGVRLHGWFLPAHTSVASPAAYLLFLHGNAGNISHRLENLAGLVRHGLAVLIFDYRGYGLSHGRPTEEGTYLDAEAAYRSLLARPGVGPSNLVIFGRSLGGAVAVELASGSPARALILESTFTSVRDMARTYFPFIPRFFVAPMYGSVNKIARVSTPALFVHGQEDDLVPVRLGRRLYEAHPGPKSFYLIPGAGHNDTFEIGGRDYYRRLVAFIRRPAGGMK